VASTWLLDFLVKLSSKKCHAGNQHLSAIKNE
jgi:hypothetical protein